MDTTPRVSDDLYEQDEFAWLGEQVRALREGRMGDLDCTNLAEFLEDMAASQRRELISRLEVLLTHRLKIMGQPERHTLSWNLTIDEQRNRISDLLDDSPSLLGHMREAIRKAYPRAVKRAAMETGKRVWQLVPASADWCPWTPDDILTYEPPDPPQREKGGVVSE